jgi:hypothetical protein
MCHSAAPVHAAACFVQHACRCVPQVLDQIKLLQRISSLLPYLSHLRSAMHSSQAQGPAAAMQHDRRVQQLLASVLDAPLEPAVHEQYSSHMEQYDDAKLEALAAAYRSRQEAEAREAAEKAAALQAAQEAALRQQAAQQEAARQAAVRAAQEAAAREQAQREAALHPRQDHAEQQLAGQHSAQDHAADVGYSPPAPSPAHPGTGYSPPHHSPRHHHPTQYPPARHLDAPHLSPQRNQQQHQPSTLYSPPRLPGYSPPPYQVPPYAGSAGVHPAQQQPSCSPPRPYQSPISDHEPPRYSPGPPRYSPGHPCRSPEHPDHAPSRYQPYRRPRSGRHSSPGNLSSGPYSPQHQHQRPGSAAADAAAAPQPAPLAAQARQMLGRWSGPRAVREAIISNAHSSLMDALDPDNLLGLASIDTDLAVAVVQSIKPFPRPRHPPRMLAAMIKDINTRDFPIEQQRAADLALGQAVKHVPAYFRRWRGPEAARNLLLQHLSDRKLDAADVSPHDLQQLVRLGAQEAFETVDMLPSLKAMGSLAKLPRILAKKLADAKEAGHAAPAGGMHRPASPGPRQGRQRSESPRGGRRADRRERDLSPSSRAKVVY